MMHDTSARYTVDELSMHVHDEDNDDGDLIKDSVRMQASASKSLSIIRSMCPKSERFS